MAAPNEQGKTSLLWLPQAFWCRMNGQQRGGVWNESVKNPPVRVL